MSANVMSSVFGKNNLYQRAKTCHGGRTKKYFTTGRRINEKSVTDMENEILKPYRTASEVNTMEDVKRYWENEKEKKIAENKSDYANRHTYRSRSNIRWKSERLFVPDDIQLPGKTHTEGYTGNEAEDNDRSTGSSMTDDIDPNYFKIVSGRPIKEKKSTREYLKDIRECFLTRLRTGYCFDQILLMDEQHTNEKQRLSQAREGFQATLKGFEEFLKEDHETSSSLLEAGKEHERKSKEKLEKLNRLKEELRNLQAAVLAVQEEWKNLKLFQKFLYTISPTEWRKGHDPYYGKEDVPESKEVSHEESNELDAKILQFQEEVRRSQPPALYFTDPKEIVSIFAELEKNNLRALTQCRDLDFPAESMLGELDKKKMEFDREETNLQEEIKYLRELVEAEERNFRENESKMKEIAFGLFRDLITNEDYLSVTSYVEDAYEDAVAPSDGSLDPVAMMKEIELKHETLLLDLDMLPNDIVIKTTKQFYRMLKRELEEAKDADRKVRQMETLLKRLSKSLSYPKKGVKERKIVPRSVPPEELMFKFRLPKIPSKEEREEMFFFGKAPEEVRLYRPLCL